MSSSRIVWDPATYAESDYLDSKTTRGFVVCPNAIEGYTYSLKSSTLHVLRMEETTSSESFLGTERKRSGAHLRVGYSEPNYFDLACLVVATGQTSVVTNELSIILLITYVRSSVIIWLLILNVFNILYWLSFSRGHYNPLILIHPITSSARQRL